MFGRIESRILFLHARSQNVTNIHKTKGDERLKVLVACEESQAVTIELRRLGHEAYSCDIIECSGGYPEWHLQQDVTPSAERAMGHDYRASAVYISDGYGKPMV